MATMQLATARYLRHVIQSKLVDEFQSDKITTEHFNRAFKLLTWQWVADECAKLSAEDAVQHLIERSRHK